MKIPSPRPLRRARLEIIPLIDIMFFLLASFMLVSVTLHRSHCLPLNLQSATTAKSDDNHSTIVISIDKSGQVFVDRTLTTLERLREQLKQRHQSNPNLTISIAGDRETPHGKIITVLDLVRSAGVQKITFNVHSIAP
jgi:biopolymer transport protein ExbD